MDETSWNRRPITERHVQALWYDDALRPQNLRTTDGVPIHVVDPGTWNVEAGPDFHHAVLEIGTARQRIVGDVEIHLHAADWRAHGHVADPAYARVIAHVTWYAAPPNLTLDGLRDNCLHICLGDFLRTRPDFSPDEIDLTAYPYAHLPATPRPCERLFARNPDFLLAVLRQAGIRRLEQKARRFQTAFVRTQDRAQAFYAETLAALGYKQNAAPFRQLAAQLPWRELPASQDAALASLSCVAEMVVARAIDWRRANVRPANSIERRLAAAAALFAGTCPALLDQFDACDLTTHGGQQAACDILCASRLIGRRRAAAILANVLVPFAYAEERIDHIPDELLPEETNAIVRLTAFRLLGRDHNPALYAGNGLYLQGLIQIHHDFCLSAHPDCDSCGLLQMPAATHNSPSTNKHPPTPNYHPATTIHPLSTTNYHLPTTTPPLLTTNYHLPTTN